MIYVRGTNETLNKRGLLRAKSGWGNTSAIVEDEVRILPAQCLAFSLAPSLGFSLVEGLLPVQAAVGK